MLKPTHRSLSDNKESGDIWIAAKFSLKIDDDLKFGRLISVPAVSLHSFPKMEVFSILCTVFTRHDYLQIVILSNQYWTHKHV